MGVQKIEINKDTVLEITTEAKDGCITVGQLLIVGGKRATSKTCTVTCSTGKSYSWTCADNESCSGDCSDPNNPKGSCYIP
jgi:hypothetical protein